MRLDTVMVSSLFFIFDSSPGTNGDYWACLVYPSGAVNYNNYILSSYGSPGTSNYLNSFLTYDTGDVDYYEVGYNVHYSYGSPGTRYPREYSFIVSDYGEPACYDSNYVYFSYGRIQSPWTSGIRNVYYVRPAGDVNSGSTNGVDYSYGKLLSGHEKTI